jgi:hypothetical protein
VPVFWDVLIASGIGFSQLVLTWYGIHISVREHRVRNAIIIGVIGALGIGLTVWGGIRNGLSQQELTGKIAKIMNGQETTNSGIEELKHAPAPTVNVNVPPPPKPSADITLDKIESSYAETVNGNLTGRHLALVPNRPLSFNIYFTNIGSAAADELKGSGRVYVTRDMTKKAQMELVRKYEHFLTHNPPQTAVLPAGDKQNAWFTVVNDRPITNDDIDQLNKGTEFIYLLFSEHWKDPSGTHYVHYCRNIKPPAFDPEIWQFCEVFEDHG